MALNLDDLIGSMQHGFHAGDRGEDLNEIRENLKTTLGQQALGPSQGQGPPNRRTQAQRQWDPRMQPASHSSLDGEVAMLSGSVEASRNQQRWPAYQHQPKNTSTCGQSPNQAMSFGGPGSYGSQGSSTSSFGIGGFAAAPANTPQQTPVETSALARQLQAELERACENQSNDCISEADERSEPDWTGYQNRQSANLSPPMGQGDYYHQFGGAQDAGQSNVTPRKLINGFSPQQGGGNGFSPPGNPNQIANPGR